ncbi:PadR family transcriptional regulator [Sporosarcina sp. ACRSM]|uniref:PadR family transcriptional regulator n=1 Tax=Sporosarcina sp. ACRSM TaxID=2918216 RepID=UPI001EF559C6|nr:PadR family transcriptional regulator [Sporosarcina sp. ACRSM]MCG7337607.1 PadR family transcriptional regulator [Sporosarcina sp. ACRSM]
MRRRRGFVQIAILHLLKEESMHGYRIMRELEERAGGFYSASAGTVYPALQELLEQEMIALEPASDKKAYLITESGMKRLEEFVKRREGDFWSEWKARFVWRSSKEAIQLKAVTEAWEEELRKAIKQARKDPEKTGKLITFIEEMTELLKKDNEGGKQ